MTQDEIIEMWTKSKQDISIFAKLVANFEREKCIKLCEDVGEHPSLTPRHCIESIRARGEA